MKIYLAASAKCIWCQAERIEQGFIELGHEIVHTPNEADIVYQNNFWFDQIIKDKLNGSIKGKIILNILDLAPHLGEEFPMSKVRAQIGYADTITCISETVKADCLTRLDKTRNYNVIYQPIQPISRTNIKKYAYDFMFCGRVQDPNKRAGIAAESLQMLGVDRNRIITTGSDFFPYGDYAGVVSNETLNELYNSVDFVLFTSAYEGIGLPIIEAMSAGKIPVICNDLNVRQEFLPSILFPEYDFVDPNPPSIAKFISWLANDPILRNDLKERLYSHYKNNLEYKFSSKGVAQAILNVYHAI